MQEVYTIIGYAEGCRPCNQAKDLLRERGLSFEFYPVEEHPVLKRFVVGYGATTLPQVFLNGHLIGGRDELKAFLHLMETSGLRELSE